MTVRSNWTCTIITQWCKWRGSGRVMIARRKPEVAFKQNNQPITLLITYPAFSAMLGLLNSRTRSYEVVRNLTAWILIWPWVAMTVNYCYNFRQWRLVLVYLHTCFRVNVDECAAIGQAISCDPDPVDLRSKYAGKCPSRREMWIGVYPKTALTKHGFPAITNLVGVRVITPSMSNYSARVWSIHSCGL